jgi:hypothetical protein
MSSGVPSAKATTGKKIKEKIKRKFAIDTGLIRIKASFWHYIVLMNSQKAEFFSIF